MRIVTFAPIDASHYNPELGTISAAALLGIDYETNTYRWRACTAEGELLGSATFGTAAPEDVSAAEVAADDHIRADIARTLPA